MTSTVMHLKNDIRMIGGALFKFIKPHVIIESCTGKYIEKYIAHFLIAVKERRPDYDVAFTQRKLIDVLRSIGGGGVSPDLGPGGGHSP